MKSTPDQLEATKLPHYSPHEIPRYVLAKKLFERAEQLFANANSMERQHSLDELFTTQAPTIALATIQSQGQGMPTAKAVYNEVLQEYGKFARSSSMVAKWYHWLTQQEHESISNHYKLANALISLIFMSRRELEAKLKAFDINLEEYPPISNKKQRRIRRMENRLLDEMLHSILVNKRSDSRGKPSQIFADITSDYQVKSDDQQPGFAIALLDEIAAGTPVVITANDTIHRFKTRAQNIEEASEGVLEVTMSQVKYLAKLTKKDPKHFNAGDKQILQKIQTQLEDAIDTLTQAGVKPPADVQSPQTPQTPAKETTSADGGALMARIGFLAAETKKEEVPCTQTYCGLPAI